MSDPRHCRGRMLAKRPLPLCAIVCQRFDDGSRGHAVAWLAPEAQQDERRTWKCVNLLTRGEGGQ